MRGLAVFLALVAVMTVGCGFALAAMGHTINVTDNLIHGTYLSAGLFAFLAFGLFLVDYRRHRTEPSVPNAKSANSDQ
jgi:hypothetical protein